MLSAAADTLLCLLGRSVYMLVVDRDFGCRTSESLAVVLHLVVAAQGVLKSKFYDLPTFETTEDVPSSEIPSR